MAEHTKEPWRFERLQTSFSIRGKAAAIASVWLPNVATKRAAVSLEEREANARRIVACVNACAGIPDPAAFVQAARGMREALERLQYWFDTDPEIIEAMTPDEQADNARQLAKIRTALTSFRAAMGEGQSDD